MKAVELFTGAGGLAIAASRCGFRPIAFFEADEISCKTINLNIGRGSTFAQEWPWAKPMDIKEVDFSPLEGEVDLVAGGPPCQPFSLGGKHRAFLDERDHFPEAIRAIRETKPKAVVLENVNGIDRPNYEYYRDYLRLQLTYPSLEPYSGEDIFGHMARLEKYWEEAFTPEYQVHFNRLNAANFGVPQKRERFFFVAFRSDITGGWSFKEAIPETHSENRLLYDQWVTGEYWRRHELQPPKAPPEAVRPRVNKLEKELFKPSAKPWLTVRDVLSDLSDPRVGIPGMLEHHEFVDGAKIYRGHTGSPIDQPSKTIKAGVHGVPGGENMIRYPDGSVRYFTIREMARIQTFPDEFVLEGPWGQKIRQLGNAVPVTLGQVVLGSVRRQLDLHTRLVEMSANRVSVPS